MPKAPDWFLKELAAFDPYLRLRWSPRLQLWQLEKKVRRSLAPGTSKTDGWHDDYVRARDGYILVCSLPFSRLNRDLFQILRNNDLWALGGWKKVADALDEYDASVEENRMKKFGETCREQARDFYNWLKIRDGRTVFNSGFLNG
jgi:hypothetical protein